MNISKLRDYCLNPQSPKGQHKARVFASALGLHARDADFLRRALLQAAREGDCVPGETDHHGRRFTLDFELRTVTGQERIRSGWIVRAGEAFPRLTTCYVVKAN